MQPRKTAMELGHYFYTVDSSKFNLEKPAAFPKHSIGNKIIRAEKDQPVSDFRKFDVALVGVPVDNGSTTDGSALAPDAVRQQLYKLPMPEKSLKIVDFGNLNPGKNLKSTLLALRDVVGYLKELEIAVVVLGGSQDLTLGICEAFKSDKYFALSVVDAQLDVKKGVEQFGPTNFLTRLFQSMPAIFQVNLLAYQRHLVADNLFQKIKDEGNSLALGKLRDDLIRIEPVLRNTDVLSFDLGAIRFSDAKGTKQNNPSGLRSEEACQIARYAGQGGKVKAFGLFEVLPKNDETTVTVRLSAEIVWYFLEGLVFRGKVKKWTTKNKKTYRVAIDQLDNPLVFFEDEQRKQWWYEIESVTGEKRIIACSNEEYVKASENEIPGQWLKYVQKMDRFSK